MKDTPYGEALGGVLLILVGTGLGALLTMVSRLLDVLIVAVTLLWVGARACGGASLPYSLGWLVRWSGAVVVPVLALLGADWLWTWRPHPGEQGVVGGLIAAGVIVIAATAVYFNSFWVWEQGHWHHGLTLIPAVALLAAPAVVGLVRWATSDHRPVASVQATAQLDVVVIGRRRPVGEVTGLVRGWGIGYYVGQAHGDTVTWDGGAGPPSVGTDTDRVVLLLPDTERPQNDTGRWARIEAAYGAGAPTFAVLRADGPDHLPSWQAAFPGHTVLEPDATGRVGLVELAEKLAVLAPTAADDHSLAIRHRPFLLFDQGEPYHRPLDVDDLIDSELLSVCPNTGLLKARGCDTVRTTRDLRNGATHLAFDVGRVARADVATTIYANVRHVVPDTGRDVAYLDYWWYLPDNPAKPAHGALCGAGLVIAEATCFDHQSDWEGVTVVVDANDPDAEPLQVIYAEHDGSTRYAWSTLVGLWHDAATAGAAFRAHAVPDVRPLVFVAHGTHASYPTACVAEHCSEPRSLVRDNRHDGAIAWDLNASLGCDATCVTALPTHIQGTKPATWNDFDGQWGTANCTLHVYCSSVNAPKSPGHQSRYKRPWCARYTIPAGRGKAKKDPDCDDGDNGSSSRTALRLAAAALG